MRLNTVTQKCLFLDKRVMDNVSIIMKVFAIKIYGDKNVNLRPRKMDFNSKHSIMMFKIIGTTK